MRNLIFGGIGVLWGGNMLLATFIQLLNGTLFDGPNNGYVAGKLSGVFFAVLMFGAGLYYLVKGCQQTYARRMQRAAGR